MSASRNSLPKGNPVRADHSISIGTHAHNNSHSMAMAIGGGYGRKSPSAREAGTRSAKSAGEWGVAGHRVTWRIVGVDCV